MNDNDMNQLNPVFTSEAKIFNALAHPYRLEIIELLHDGEACVCHIQAMLDRRQAYISQHLNVLRQAGLVTCRKDGQRIYYKISDQKILEVIDQLRTILQSPGKRQPGTTSERNFVDRKKSCKCPQCTSKPAVQEAIPLGVHIV